MMMMMMMMNEDGDVSIHSSLLFLSLTLNQLFCVSLDQLCCADDSKTAECAECHQVKPFTAFSPAQHDKVRKNWSADMKCLECTRKIKGVKNIKPNPRRARVCMALSVLADPHDKDVAEPTPIL